MIVYEDLNLPGGGAPSGLVEVELFAAGRPTVGRNMNDGSLIAGKATVQPDASGIWSLDLVPNSDIAPANTTYRVVRYINCESFTSYLSVPASGGPYDAFLIGDDAMNEIPASVLAQHSADLALHGGGIEVDYSELVTNYTATGDASNLGVVPALNVYIPDLGRPVHVFYDMHLSSPSGTIDVSTGLAPWNGVATLQGAFGLKGGASEQDVDTDTNNPRHVSGMVRVPSHTPGLWAVSARKNSADYRVIIVANSVLVAKIWAVTA